MAPNRQQTKRQFGETATLAPWKGAQARETLTENLLIEGENLSALRELAGILAGKVDLVYIDPPFATKGVFRIGEDRVATISSQTTDEVAYTDLLQGAEFLEFLRERLVAIRELMSERASIYLHIDDKIGHYVKVLMDEVFGATNFRNHITRIKCNPKNFRRAAYGNVKDMLLFYTKGESYTWNEPREELKEEDVQRRFGKVDEAGRHYTTTPLHAPGETKNGATGTRWKGLLPPVGRHWRVSPTVLDDLDSRGLIEWSSTGNPRKKIFAEDHPGSRVQDVWSFKDPQSPRYPTEKNAAMLERIITTSSDPGDLVLDAFCGGGTTLATADALGRKWIGIDQSRPAIEVSTQRLEDAEFRMWRRDCLPKAA